MHAILVLLHNLDNWNFHLSLFSSSSICVQIPNVVGFILGVIQMALYVIYKNSKTVVPMEPKLPQHNIDIAKLSTASCEMKPAVCPHSNEEDDHTENSKDPSNQEQPRQCEVWFEDLAR